MRERPGAEALERLVALGIVWEPAFPVWNENLLNCIRLNAVILSDLNGASLADGRVCIDDLERKRSAEVDDLTVWLEASQFRSF